MGNPLLLLFSFVIVVLIPSFHFDQKKEEYLWMVIAGMPWIIFLVSVKYLRKDDDITADDGFKDNEKASDGAGFCLL